MTWHALSLGAGVNSTAMLHLILDKGLPLDEVVMADTGAEKPETYAYIDAHIRPFLAARGIEYTVVRAKETLRERCYRSRAIPDRRYRWSTRDYKIRPIYKHLKARAPVVCYLGIGFDEPRRVKQEYAVDWLRREWPLVDARMSRADCAKLIESKGWPVPPKSGCYFCPFQSIPEWRDLHRSHPELYAEAANIEQNGSKYPKFTLVRGRTLVQLAARFEREKENTAEQSKLEDYDECEGFCFT